MNEQIKKLWDQSKTSGVHPEFGEYDMYSAEKFAELIVQECAQLVLGVPTDTMGYNTADQKIKQHFGVAE
jgi:hypothetical protein